MSDYTSQKYDVFISFRGEDTRVDFTSHLHKALCREKIETYVDYRLEKGDEISSALLKAIEESKISIIIFSKNYATSTWCLDELVHILECRKTKKQLVVPVFYRVDPSQVRKQEESYAITLSTVKGRFRDDKILEWRTALTTAANLVGWSSSAISPDSTLIDGITQDILRKLKSVPCADDYEGQLVGMTKHIENVELFLCIGSPTVRRIGIWGLAGMGKTILANVVFNRLSYQFEACCFLGSIGENWDYGRKSSYLRSKLFSVLLEANDHQNMDTLLLASFDKNRLQRKKVLIVLDDVNDLEQLDTLIGDCSFGPESRIIVTTRDKQLLKNVVDQMYQVKELTYDEALQLFHMSLKGITPPAHLTEVVDKVAYYSGGIPRAVKFLGFLFGSKEVENWEKELEKLKKLLPGRIEDFLTTSYNQLDGKQKTIFLDIACFFKGNNKDYVESILDGCELFASTGIVDLIDKCLITTMDKQLRMFDLVQSMGWEIVRKQCIEEPGKRSRIWLAQDVCHVLTNNTGTEAVEGILLNMSEMLRMVNAGPTVFKKMYKLRFLKFHNNNVHGDCKVYFPYGLRSFPDNLVYLHWDQYPLRSLPPKFIAESLVEINMRNSQVEKLWSGVQHLGKLKKIDLSYSKNLTQIPDLSKASNLEYVYLDHCTSLCKIPASFQYLDKLDTLILEGCSSLKKLPKLAPNIRCLVLNETAIEEVPSSIEFVSKLEILCLRDCRRLVSLPTSICKLKSLDSLCLSGCLKLKTFPEILEPMACLTILQLDGTGITEFPFSVRNLIGIQPLNVNILQNPKLIPSTMCKLEFSKCLFPHQQRSRVPHSYRPVYYLREKVRKTVMETLSISTNALILGLNDSRLRGRQFLLYNCLELGRKAYYVGIKDDRCEDAKSFHKEIRSSIVERKFSIDDFGIFHLGDGIPNWFCYQSKGSFVRVDMEEQLSSSLLGFAMCVVIKFTETYSRSQHIKLLCQPSYILEDGQKLSWDFYWNSSSDEAARIVRSFQESALYFDPVGPQILSSISHRITKALFEFCCVDENYEPLEGCIVQRCGVHLLLATESFEDDLIFHSLVKNCAVKEEPEPSSSGYESDHSYNTEENEEDGPSGCIPLEVVSISSSTLLELRGMWGIHDKFRVHNFMEPHERACNEGIANPTIRIFDGKMPLSEFKRELFSREDSGACCLGNDMNPNWFSYQSKGSSLDAHLPPNWPDPGFLGFVVCAVIDTTDLSLHDHQRLKLLCHCHYVCDFSHSLSWNFQGDYGCTPCCGAHNRSFNLDHKFQWSLDKKRKRKCRRNGLTNEEVVMASFNFWCVDENNEPLEKCRIIECGIQLLYAEELDLISDQNSFKAAEEEEDISEFELKGSGNRTVNFELKEKEKSEPSGCKPMEVVSVQRPMQQLWNEFEFSYFFELHESLRGYVMYEDESKFELKVSDIKRDVGTKNQEMLCGKLHEKLSLEKCPFQSEGSSITVNIPSQYSPSGDVVGFLVSAVVELRDDRSDSQCIKLLCRPHYMGKFSRLLSWDFYVDQNCVAYSDIDQYNAGNASIRFNYRSLSDSYFPSIRDGQHYVVGITFEFWCVDENYNPLDGCIVRKCAVKPITENEEEEKKEDDGSVIVLPTDKEEDEEDNESSEKLRFHENHRGVEELQ